MTDIDTCWHALTSSWKRSRSRRCRSFSSSAALISCPTNADFHGLPCTAATAFNGATLQDDTLHCMQWKFGGDVRTAADSMKTPLQMRACIFPNGG